VTPGSYLACGRRKARTAEGLGAERPRRGPGPPVEQVPDFVETSLHP
jgi:hypothetical protein